MSEVDKEGGEIHGGWMMLDKPTRARVCKHEWTEEFDNLDAARKLTKAWRQDYNQFRPHSSLGYLTPNEFAARETSAEARQKGAAPVPPCDIARPQQRVQAEAMAKAEGATGNHLVEEVT